MKSWLIIFVLLAFCVPTWGQSAANHFHFVSSIYTPYGSFGTVETKPKSGTTKIGGGVIFNIGSKLSAGGDIKINGAPLNISKLKMKDKTSISSETNWFMDTLTLGKDAEVSVKTLIAGTVKLENASDPENQKETNLEVEKKLLIDAQTYTNEGSASTSLEATWPTDGQFHFIKQSEEPKKNATWKKLELKEAVGETEAVVQVSKVYPIRTID